jgi:hypothetical protein
MLPAVLPPSEIDIIYFVEELLHLKLTGWDSHIPNGLNSGNLSLYHIHE